MRPPSLRLRSCCVATCFLAQKDMSTAAIISGVLLTSAEEADRTVARRDGPIEDEADWVSEKIGKDKGQLGSYITKTALLSFL